MSDQDSLEDRLTNRQIKFCQEYVIDFNGSRAAIAAGYSEDSAKEIASENLTKPNIKLYLEQIQRDLAASADITKEKLVAALRTLAFYDRRKYYDEEGNLLPINQLDEESAFAIVESTVDEIRFGDTVIGNTKKLKTSDRRAAIESLAKMLGFNAAEKRELTGANGGPIQTTGEHKVVIEDFTNGQYTPEEPGD